MSTEPQALIQRLVGALPTLRDPYEAVRQDCEREGLGDHAPEIFVDEYTRYLIAPAARSGPDADAAARQFAALAAFLDGEYGYDADADRLIELSFLALLPSRPSPGDERDVRSLLGPRLAAVLGAEREWRADPAAQAFVMRMRAAVPLVAPDAAGNRFGDHGDVLISIFLSDVAVRAADAFRSAAPAGISQARSIIDFLEAEFGADAGVDNAIKASFLENLPDADKDGAAIVQLLGPRLRTELNRQRA